MATNPARSHAIAIAVALLVTVLWSSSWVLIRFGLDDEALPPITFAGLRYGSAALVLWGWIVCSGRRRRAVRVALSRARLPQVAALGVVMYAITQGAQFIAIDSQPAASTSLVLSLTPLGVAWLGARALSERSTGHQLVGATLIAGGAGLFVAGDLAFTAVGAIAACCGLLANVTGALLGRRVNRTAALDAVAVTAVSMTVGAVILVVVGLSVDGIPGMSARLVAIVLWLAIVNTAAAFTAWNWSMRHLSATESSGLNNTMLVQIGLLAWIFLDEYPGLLGLSGIAVVSAGVLLTQRRARSCRRW